MPPAMAVAPALNSLKDLTLLVQTSEGFHPVANMAHPAEEKLGSRFRGNDEWGTAGR